MPAKPEWRRVAKVWLERLGLLGAAFRVWEGIKTFESKYSERLYESGTGPVGLPVPPPRLVVAVGGHNNVEAFLEGGRRLARRIQGLLERHEVRLENLTAVLDFGCGSGRIIRQWRFGGSPAPSGCDHDAGAIVSCASHLPHAEFAANGQLPPLPYRDGMFGLVYAFSVFTHFTEEMQFAWMREMAPVIRPGGFLVKSVHGATYAGVLTPDESAAFARGELVVRYGSVAGSNLCAAFHPRAFVDRMARSHFEVIDCDVQHGDQDLLLLRRTDA